MTRLGLRSSLNLSDGAWGLGPFRRGEGNFGRVAPEMARDPGSICLPRGFPVGCFGCASFKERRSACGCALSKGQVADRFLFGGTADAPKASVGR